MNQKHVLGRWVPPLICQPTFIRVPTPCWYPQRLCKQRSHECRIRFPIPNLGKWSGRWGHSRCGRDYHHYRRSGRPWCRRSYYESFNNDGGGRGPMRRCSYHYHGRRSRARGRRRYYLPFSNDRCGCRPVGQFLRNRYGDSGLDVWWGDSLTFSRQDGLWCRRRCRCWRDRRSGDWRRSRRWSGSKRGGDRRPTTGCEH